MEYASPTHTLKLLGLMYVSNQARTLSLIQNFYSWRFINISWLTVSKATDESIAINQSSYLFPQSIEGHSSILLRLSHNCNLLYTLIGNKELVHTLSSAC